MRRAVTTAAGQFLALSVKVSGANAPPITGLALKPLTNELLGSY